MVLVARPSLSQRTEAAISEGGAGQVGVCLSEFVPWLICVGDRLSSMVISISVAFSNVDIP